MPSGAAADLTLLETMVRAVRAAGEAAMAARAAGISVRAKADSSPVTCADEAAEAAVLAILAEAAPGIPVVAEERVAKGEVPDTGAPGGDAAFFLVDALDGTKEFVNGGDDFTANVALIRGGVPVLGVVGQPAAGAIYLGALGSGAWKEQAGTRAPIAVRRPDPAGLVAVASKSHRTPETDDYLARFNVRESVSIGSSLKFCLVAEGRADLYPRLGRTMEWDTAAGHAVLIAAGGAVFTLDAAGQAGGALAYGKRRQAHDADFANSHFVGVGEVTLLADM